MKTLEEIIKQPPVYLNNWGSKFSVIAEFEGEYISLKEFESENPPYPNKEAWENRKKSMEFHLKTWESVNILFASYATGSYEGDAFVLLEKEGKLFEVNASHCSCYGLENQFDPEETSLEVLKHRLLEGRLGKDNYCGNEFNNELIEFLGV